jgi:hypothetical protein
LTPDRLRWLTPIGQMTDEEGHGTCVAAQIVGQTNGVAKNANLVLLKSPEDTSDIQLLDDWTKIYNDAVINNLAHKSIIVYSTSCKVPSS